MIIIKKSCEPAGLFYLMQSCQANSKTQKSRSSFTFFSFASLHKNKSFPTKRSSKQFTVQLTSPSRTTFLTFALLGYLPFGEEAVLQLISKLLVLPLQH